MIGKTSQNSHFIKIYIYIPERKYLNVEYMFQVVDESTRLLKEDSKPVIVAVIDTGIYENHPHLKDKILTEHSKCFVEGW